MAPDLWQCELSEHGCQAIVIDVPVCLDGYVQDVDRFVLDTLDVRADVLYLYNILKNILVVSDPYVLREGTAGGHDILEWFF